MNIGIIIIASTILFVALRALVVLRRDKEKPRWVIKAQCVAALAAIAWALLDIIQEVWRNFLSDRALSYMKFYASIIFGLCLGILLTLWISGQIRPSENQPKTK